MNVSFLDAACTFSYQSVDQPDDWPVVDSEDDCPGNIQGKYNCEFRSKTVTQRVEGPSNGDSSDDGYNPPPAIGPTFERRVLSCEKICKFPRFEKVSSCIANFCFARFYFLSYFFFAHSGWSICNCKLVCIHPRLQFANLYLEIRLSLYRNMPLTCLLRPLHKWVFFHQISTIPISEVRLVH